MDLLEGASSALVGREREQRKKVVKKKGEVVANELCMLCEKKVTSLPTASMFFFLIANTGSERST